jgi:hypothetical protein
MRLMRLLHKWLSLIVGLQLLLWTVSGLMFAWLEHDTVMAHETSRTPSAPVLADSVAIFEPAGLLAGRKGASLQDVTLMSLGDDWVYRLRSTDGTELRRAADGTRYVITESVVRALATTHYAGRGSLNRIALRQPPVLEARGAGAVWEVSYDDADGTTLYFSNEDGRFVAARNDTWRLFDLFWMLHTMDFRGRDDFNNPLVILFTTGALWVGMTGALLLFQVFGVTARLKSGLRSRDQTAQE